MTKKIFYFTTFIIFNCYYISAQNETDALKYSETNLFGNAKFISMGGAFGSLGGDISSSSYNPAGIGLYYYNEFVFSPKLNFNSNTSYFNSSRIENSTAGLNNSSIGMVLSYSPNNSETSDWKRINIALSLNQLASYDRRLTIEGENNQTSFADNMLALSQGSKINNLNSFHTSLAFWTDLIDLADNAIDTTVEPPVYLNDNGNYISHINGNSNKNQYKNIESTGNQNELAFSIASSYNEKIYIGATIGIPYLNYYENSNYQENNFSDTINGLEEFGFNEELSVYGEGINLKLGGLLKINNQLKLGAAFHSPTFFKIEETYNTNMYTQFEYENFQEYSPVNYFEYELITPWKAILSGSTSFNKLILISADYEVVDYTFTKMSSNIYSFQEENEAVQNNFNRSINLKIGTEIKLQSLALRCGYAQYESPTKDQELSKKNYSFGLGNNAENFGGYFFDIAYLLSQSQNNHQLYNNVFINPILVNNTDHYLILTVGFRFQ